MPPPLDTSEDLRRPLLVVSRISGHPLRLQRILHAPLWVVSLVPRDAPCVLGMRVYYFCRPPTYPKTDLCWWLGSPWNTRDTQSILDAPLRVVFVDAPSELYLLHLWTPPVCLVWEFIISVPPPTLRDLCWWLGSPWNTRDTQSILDDPLWDCIYGGPLERFMLMAGDPPGIPQEMMSQHSTVISPHKNVSI